MTKIRKTPLSKVEKNENGENLCRWCKSIVKPPKRTFCSKDCIHEYRIRSNPGYARDFVYERDLGICESCGVDTRFTKIELENLRRKLGKSYQENDEYKQFCKILSITVKESLKSLWHMDHKNPVFMGGGECGLDNLVTKCIKCHKMKTKTEMKK